MRFGCEHRSFLEEIRHGAGTRREHHLLAYCELLDKADLHEMTAILRHLQPWAIKVANHRKLRERKRRGEQIALDAKNVHFVNMANRPTYTTAPPTL